MIAFVDCGAYSGTAIRWFRENPLYSAPDAIYAFECNPSMMKNYGSGVTAIHSACWTHDGTIEFYRNPTSPNIQGNSVYRDKTTGDLDKDHPIVVPCIDFSAWLKRTFTSGDTVIVKMNIEGAEYDVLEKCVLDNSIALITELHIQWHNRKIPGIDSRHVALLGQLKAMPHLKLYHGYNRLRSK